MHLGQLSGGGEERQWMQDQDAFLRECLPTFMQVVELVMGVRVWVMGGISAYKKLA